MMAMKIQSFLLMRIDTPPEISYRRG
jgi:hypothetical protein